MKEIREITVDKAEFGLSQKTIETLRAVFATNEKISCVMLYGSRAKGNFKNHSDIDLAIMNAITFDELLRLETEIDDLLIPQAVDLIRLDSIENDALKDLIERVGRVFYKR